MATAAETSGSEEQIMQACKNRLRDEVPPDIEPLVSVSGVVVGMYEFLDNEGDGIPQQGFIYLSNKADRITVVKGEGPNDRGRIEFPYARSVNFWICGTEDTESYLKMVKQIMGLKHNGLLKMHLTVYSVQLCKMVSAFGSTSKTLQDWLTEIPIKTSTYFSSEEKELLLTLYNCVEYLWEQGFTSDAFSDVNSYRMLDRRIKLNTLVLRRRTVQETDFLPVKDGLATLLEDNFLPKWPDVEFQDFINFLREPYSSTISIIGHPIFLPPKIRQVLYRSLSVTHMSLGQVEQLNERVQPPPNWTNTITEQKYHIVLSILNSEKNINGNGVSAALLLAHHVSAHYVQHLKRRETDWQNHLQQDTIDRYLKECFPGLLTKRYALNQDPFFRNA